MGESAIQRRIIEHLRDGGVWAFVVHGTPYQHRGLPDIVACWEGRFCGLEVKEEGASLTPMQTLTLRRIRDAGGIGEVVGSVEDVEAIMEKVRTG